MAKRILILGASGFVGYALFKSISQNKGFKAMGTYLRHRPMAENSEKSGKNNSLQQLDVTSPRQLQQFLRQTNPDVIINTVAISTIDACEKNQRQCDHINTEPTKTIVEYCQNKPRVKYIFFSSDQVFNGKKEKPYTKTDIPAPLNYYGTTKLRCEQMIATTLQNYTLLRPCFVYGLPQPYQHPNLFTAIYAALKKNKPFLAYQDKIRSPCYLEDISPVVEQIIRKNKKGLFLIGGETMTVYEFARKIAYYFHFDQKLVVGIDSRRHENIPRPRNCALDRSWAEKSLGIQFHSVTQAFDKMKVLLS